MASTITRTDEAALMAYLLDIRRKCMRCNRRTATHELHNLVNATIGAYCAACGEVALRAQRDSEAAQLAREHAALTSGTLGDEPPITRAP